MEKETEKETESVIESGKGAPVVVSGDEHLEKAVSSRSAVNPDIVGSESDKVADTPPPAPESSPIQSESVKFNGGVRKRPKKGVTDKHGRDFNPDIHLSNPDGSPKISKKHGYISCKPGNRNDSKKREYAQAGAESASGLPKQDATPSDAAELQQRKIVSALSANMFWKFGVAIFGEEWYPVKNEKEDEELALIQGFDRYYASVGVVDIPPGWALVAVMGQYAAVRFGKEKTRSKISVMWENVQKISGFAVDKIKGFFKKLKGIKNASFVDSGNDRERKDDSGKASSASL